MSYSGKSSDLNPSKIIGIQFSVLSPEEIRKGSVAEITSRDTYANNKPCIGGLFDPRMGVLDPGLLCPTDGLNYMQTPGYFGHIELARPVFYIQYLEIVKKILRCVCFKCSKLQINKEKHKHILKMSAKDRWDYVFSIASKATRCGEDIQGGCGALQPRKIYKQDLANIYAEWPAVEGVTDEDGEDLKEKPTIRITPEMVIKMFRRFTDEDINFMGFSPVWSRPEWFVCQVLAIPPPAVRPSVKHDAQQRSEDDISHIIVLIIKINNTLKEKLRANAPPKQLDNWSTVLQYYVATMVDNRIPGAAPVAQRSGRALKSIKERLIGKQGRVRGNLMGKRVDYSARSVIGPDPQLSIRELGVPIKIAKNITFPAKVNKRTINLLTKMMLNGPDKYPGANILQRENGESISLRYVDRNSIKLEYGDVVHRHMLNGDPVLFNRQPTLHRMSMMCHIAKIMKEGNTFRMNVADTKPYNADFDGDEMNLHMPQDEQSQAELIHLAAIPHQIISPANNASIIGIFQDSLLGCYRFTRKDITFTSRQAMNLMMSNTKPNVELFKDPNKKTSNFELLSDIMPPMSAKFANSQFDSDENRKTSNNIVEIVNGKYLRGQLDKGVLGGSSKGLIQSIFNDFSHRSSSDFIDRLQFLVNDYMKTSSYSVGVSDLIADDETNNKITNVMSTKKREVYNLIDQLHLSVFENNTGKTNSIEFETKVNSILNNAQEEAGKIGRKSLSKDNRFLIMVEAGSKGKNINILQMVSCLGQQNVDGKRIPYGYEDRTLPHFKKYDDSPEARGFVESSFIQGLTPEELYFHAMGGRVGLIDTAVKTSQTGYIQRRLIKGLEDLKLTYDMTIRNNKNKIIQFSYGDDNISPMNVENQGLPLVKMTLEDIYMHYQIPKNIKDDDVLSVFTKSTINKMKKERVKLSNKTKEVIDMMVNVRDDLIKHVFNHEGKAVVHIPVHFGRLLNNVIEQLLLKTNMVDITPLETYNIIDEAYKKLEQNALTKPTRLFKIAWYYNLSPKKLLIMHRFTRKALNIYIELLVYNYKKAIAHPGEMCGMIAAQSIGEPTTQMTLNTFHFAGVASKSNVTRGLPRIEEILSLSENPKNPSVTIMLRDEDKENIEKAQELKYKLEYTNLRDIVDTVTICFDPKKDDTLIDSDKAFVDKFLAYESMMCELGAEEGEMLNSNEFSKWIIRFEMSREQMLDKNITMDDVDFAIKNAMKNEIQCVYNDFNDDNLIFRIRIKSTSQYKHNNLDQTDEIFKLKNVQNQLLDNIILRGVKNIPKIILRKVVNYMTKENGNYVPKDIWVLDTVGTNLIDILAQDDIESRNTTSNDIQEVYKTLGIEAARQSIHNELLEAIDGTYINYHHTSMLADRMTCSKKLISIFRHGINNDDIGPIAKASFEETPEMFLRAARHAELDLMTGVSSNIMCGQFGYFGTGSFQVLLNTQKLSTIQSSAEYKKQSSVEDILDEDNSNECSVNNISIANTTVNLNESNTGVVDDDYDLDI
jgi:DNA-directed RNA polymerase II subunit RPB1